MFGPSVAGASLSRVAFNVGRINEGADGKMRALVIHQTATTDCNEIRFPPAVDAQSHIPRSYLFQIVQKNIAYKHPLLSNHRRSFRPRSAPYHTHHLTRSHRTLHSRTTTYAAVLRCTAESAAGPLHPRVCHVIHYISTKISTEPTTAHAQPVRHCHSPK